MGRRAGEVAAALIHYARPVCELEHRWVFVHPDGFGDLMVSYDPEAELSWTPLSPQERAAAYAALWDEEGQDGAGEARDGLEGTGKGGEAVR
ncbi:hypothetical protein [Kitasatospora viridis]|nr:hypothetical protein [Kitasatospora viridis]